MFWNLNTNNPDGCEECKCNRTGILGGIGVCDTESGQCVCKPSVISRSCSECADGTYGLQEGSLFGCKGEYWKVYIFTGSLIQWLHEFNFQTQFIK